MSPQPVAKHYFQYSTIAVMEATLVIPLCC